MIGMPTLESGRDDHPRTKTANRANQLLARLAVDDDSGIRQAEVFSNGDAQHLGRALRLAARIAADPRVPISP